MPDIMLTTTLLLLTLSSAPAAPATKPAAAAEKKLEFDKHYLVLLKRAPNAPKMEPDALQKLQGEHLAHLTRMGESGKMVLAGPFDEQDDVGMRGACIYRTATKQEARQLAEQDPMVKAGRLQVEVLAWYTEKGYLAFPKAPPAEAPKPPRK
ncbi:YciI family protein [Corallococcus coralloides]|uniref:YciI family protein n=1 Tax=Corallococcus coralloides TaxID=184914 RepID=UPI001ED95853|nr:YciI family protein [Corallococcus coralloides]